MAARSVHDLFRLSELLQGPSLLGRKMQQPRQSVAAVIADLSRPMSETLIGQVRPPPLNDRGAKPAIDLFDRCNLVSQNGSGGAEIVGTGSRDFEADIVDKAVAPIGEMAAGCDRSRAAEVVVAAGKHAALEDTRRPGNPEAARIQRHERSCQQC